MPWLAQVLSYHSISFVRMGMVEMKGQYIPFHVTFSGDLYILLHNLMKRIRTGTITHVQYPFQLNHCITSRRHRHKFPFILSRQYILLPDHAYQMIAICFGCECAITQLTAIKYTYHVIYEVLTLDQMISQCNQRPLQCHHQSWNHCLS